MGVVSRFCTPYSEPFESLLKKVKNRFCDLSTEGSRAISGGIEVEVIDIGANFNFSDDLGKFNTWCGPMNKEQIKAAPWFAYKKEEEIPVVGLYFSSDYHKKPSDPIGLKEICSFLDEAAKHSWARHERVRSLIVGPQ